jgi:hypothetical protein
LQPFEHEHEDEHEDEDEDEDEDEWSESSPYRKKAEPNQALDTSGG